MANTFFIFLTAAFFHVSLSSDYNYNTSDTTYGPNGWANTYPEFCNGSRQSPIDIMTSKVSYDGSLGELSFQNYDTVAAGSMVTIGNNGKSFTVSFKGKTFSVSGGGLPAGTFYTLNFHLHWGADDTKGSEHTIDGKKFPLELHIVHVNTKYPSVSEALKQKDGITVLGILYKVGDEDQALQSFLKYTANVTHVKDIQNVTMPQALKSLLPEKTTDFYRYDGSLTTPKCDEAVTWTVFKNYRTVSDAQLSMLRSLHTKDHKTLVDTFRPVQPLGPRVVKRSWKIDSPTTGSTTTGSTATGSPTTDSPTTGSTTTGSTATDSPTTDSPTTGSTTTGSTATDSHGESYHVTNTMIIIVSLVMAMVMSK